MLCVKKQQQSLLTHKFHALIHTGNHDFSLNLSTIQLKQVILRPVLGALRLRGGESTLCLS